MITIYKITNKINGKNYIGKTKNINRRWHDHQRLAFVNGHKEYDKPLYQAFRKYGIENFSFTIIETINDEIGNEREQYWIQKYDSYNNGYNASQGGDGGSEKGHCAGSSNGRSKLTEKDIVKIRTFYQQGISKQECYLMFQDKISESGFARIWLGKTWTHIMPEVFTTENKKRNEKLGKSLSAYQRRILTEKEVIDIRKMKENNIPLKDIVKKYQTKASKSCIADVYYGHTYKEVK